MKSEKELQNSILLTKVERVLNCVNSGCQGMRCLTV